MVIMGIRRREKIMLKNIEWIFFDVGSTLVDESKAFQHRIEDAIAGTSIAYQQFYDTMLTYYKQNQKGDLETIKYYGLIQTKWHKEDEILYPDATACLKALSKKYKIGIIANQSLGTAERLKKFGLLETIDLVIASAEEGVSKPNLRIYEIALERAKCKAENAVMIGDRLDNDIAPANSIGMKTIWIKQGFGRFSTPQKDMEEANYITHNLKEVYHLFEI